MTYFALIATYIYIYILVLLNYYFPFQIIYDKIVSPNIYLLT